MKTLLGLLLLPAVVGCSRPQESPPFKTGGLITASDGPTSTRRPAPVLMITSPPSAADYSQGDPITCEVEVTVPEGGKLPTGLVFEIRKGNVISTSASAKPKERKPDGRYVFEGRLNCPKRPGRYTLLARSWDMTMPSGGVGGKTSYVLSPGIEVRVGAER